MDFKEVTEQLMDRCTIQDIADAFGVSRNSIERARMAGDAYRSPPANWQLVLAKLARDRGVELQALADQLEKAG